MFGLFKRKKVFAWENEMLSKTFYLLGEQYIDFKNQIDEKLLNRARTDDPGMINYIGFSYNPDVAAKYERRLERFFKICGVKVLNKKDNQFSDIEIYLHQGLVMGYSSSKMPFEADNNIKISTIKKILLDEDNESFKKLTKMLSNEELNLLNPSDVYELIIDDTTYYHLKDIGDGDFIGLDVEKNIFEITHDPFEVTKLQDKLIDVLK